MPDPTARLNAALEGRYSIERGLGEGRVAVALRATSRSWFIFSVQGGDPDAEGDATTPMRLTAAVTIRLDPKLEELLDEVCRETGQSRSEVVRDALRRQLTLRLFEEARRKVIPLAEAQGVYTDEDVFKLMS